MEKTLEQSRAPDLMTALRWAARDYFKEKGISRHANIAMYLKICIILICWVGCYLSMYVVNFEDFSFWAGFFLLSGFAILMGCLMAMVGMCIMHDAAHGSLSQKKWVNNVFAHTIVPLAGDPGNWRIQHNILHHTHTNITGKDHDVESGGIMKFSMYQKTKWIHRFQHIYAPFVYGIMTIWWVVAKDFVQLHTFHKMGLEKKTTQQKVWDWIELGIGKAIYVFIWILLPLWFWDMSFGQIMFFFVLMHFVCGVLLGFVFQLAHVVPQAEMFDTEKDAKTEWAEHQIATSVGFATDSIIVSSLLGGLNHQDLHHLFPNICHVHYRKLRPIIEQVARNYNGTELKENPTFFVAICKHLSHLKYLGREKNTT